jgi:hypothetical protein
LTQSGPQPQRQHHGGRLGALMKSPNDDSFK